jgi:hypothetical protein
VDEGDSWVREGFWSGAMQKENRPGRLRVPSPFSPSQLIGYHARPPPRKPDTGDQSSERRAAPQTARRFRFPVLSAPARDPSDLNLAFGSDYVQLPQAFIHLEAGIDR